MLVILVKLCKVIEYKKQLIGQLTLINDYAEKMNTLSNVYPEEFKVFGMETKWGRKNIKLIIKEVKIFDQIIAFHQEI